MISNLQNQLNAITQKIAKILSDSIVNREKGKLPWMANSTKKVITTEMGIDLNEIRLNELIDNLQVKYKFSNEQLDQFSDLLFQMGEAEKSAGSNDYLFLMERVKIIFEYLNKNDKTYSYIRHKRLEKINLLFL